VFSKNKLIDTIEKYNNLSPPGPDKLTWSHIKSIIRNDDCICKFIDIANTCIKLGHWLPHFKAFTMVVQWLLFLNLTRQHSTFPNHIDQSFFSILVTTLDLAQIAT